ncbi:hypothetical protein TNCV_676231 [Trichonephila clavipes]|nr:hypothetical protein TNCV_676231 [Trichonephila clavipes]
MDHFGNHRPNCSKIGIFIYNTGIFIDPWKSIFKKLVLSETLVNKEASADLSIGHSRARGLRDLRDLDKNFDSPVPMESVDLLCPEPEMSLN